MSRVAANPCDQLERPKAAPALPRGLPSADIKKLLNTVPDTPIGLRDRAINLTLILTGRRRAEVLMRAFSFADVLKMLSGILQGLRASCLNQPHLLFGRDH